MTTTEARRILRAAKDTPANARRYKMTLDSQPNPDFRETRKPAPRMDVTFAFREDAAAIGEAYCAAYDLGGGNFSYPAIIDRATGRPCAWLAYNGRIFTPAEWDHWHPGALAAAGEGAR